jgi:hypothetical protein
MRERRAVAPRGRRVAVETSSMRGMFLSMLVVGGVACSAARGDESEVKLDDATRGAKPPAGAIVLLGEGATERWIRSARRTPADWKLADGILTVGHGNIMTEKSFGNFELHVEFNVPYMPDQHGQARGNSGIFLTGNYELQVLDSYGLKCKDNDCGAIYKQVTPAVNACKPPLQWQTYDITFHKAVVQDGKVLKKARITVLQNGVRIIDDAEISPTPGGVGIPEGHDGPILLQDHGNPVQYRNIWIKPID